MDHNFNILRNSGEEGAISVFLSLKEITEGRDLFISERAVFYDLARLPGRNRWQLHSQVCLLFVNEQKTSF